MRVLVVSRDLIAATLSYRLAHEGCDVKLFIEVERRKASLDNMVRKTHDWRKELRWVGKGGLIVFDDIGYGAVQEQLRREGYSVFGGSRLADRLEEDREWCQKVFAKHGLTTLPTKNFPTIAAAIAFLRRSRGPWVIKENGFVPKDFNYVGHFPDNRDVISVLSNYSAHNGESLGMITLQKRVYGVEIGIGRYFNGDDWVGPIELNIEHKKLFPGDTGPATTEMGTVAWYAEKSPLFDATLAKLKPFLQEIDFRGDIDIGCIVNRTGIYPLEATPRLGTPIVHLHSEIHASPWHLFLKAVADKKPFHLKWKKGYGVVVLVSLPPFPYNRTITEPSPVGIDVHFESSMTSRDLSHVHFEGVSVEHRGRRPKRLFVSDPLGYVLYVTAMGATIGKARQRAHSILKKIHIPKMLYRYDIGSSFEAAGKRQLEQWGYL